ncbi:MAG TPA: hypothetical protein ENK19_05810 [Acidobacteria bacterium]|nr:hypothetical protein [Acidobacteriota bacterium]
MARVDRLRIVGVETWRHVYGRVVGRRGEYPLAQDEAQRYLIALIERLSSVYFVEVAAFVVMGDHYHMVVHVPAPHPVSREELETRARRWYLGRSSAAAVGSWADEDWERFRERLFDLSECMRNLQGEFGRWFNDQFHRRGKLWGERYKSVLLGDLQTVFDCMLYVELNPVRAGIAERPEEWAGSSIHLRTTGEESWLMPLEDVLEGRSREEALLEYRQRMSYRGALPPEDGLAPIPEELLAEEVALGYVREGMFREPLGYFVDGVALGSREFILEQIAKMREEGRYKRGKNPIPQLGGIHWSLREQRGHGRHGRSARQREG